MNDRVVTVAKRNYPRNGKANLWLKAGNHRRCQILQVDEQPFDQKLFGANKRAQTRTSVDLGLNKQLDSRHKLYLNYQYSKTQDKKKYRYLTNLRGIPLALPWKPNF